MCSTCRMVWSFPSPPPQCLHGFGFLVIPFNHKEELRSEGKCWPEGSQQEWCLHQPRPCCCHGSVIMSWHHELPQAASLVQKGEL